MRAGLCSTQQGLTIEAATIVKQAISLAKRRGHSQVTPLHVASSMLASSASLLRKACLQTHSHPLQCKALELCFNVALNRLPTSTSSSFLSAHNYPATLPSLSNALVAAFKRAQAHQRRGTIESQQQQQPILTLKIELEQLVISILDDPSVSRVMREAGLSSTQVKNKVEQFVPFDQNVKPEPLSRSSPPFSMKTSPEKSYDHRVIIRNNNEDVTSVLNMLVCKRRSTIIVGESLSTVEGVVREVTDIFEKGFGDTKNLQFISLPLFSLRNLSKEEIELKFMDLRCIARSYMGGDRSRRGIVLYLGDLKWLLSDFLITCGTSYVEEIIMELKRLVFDGGIEENGRLMIMGIANFQTYSNCTTGNPSLEALLNLHQVTVPVANLNLSLNLDSDWSRSKRSKTNINDRMTGETESIYNHTKINLSWPIDIEPKRSPKEYQFWVTENPNDDVALEPHFTKLDPKPDLLSNPNSTPNSTSSTDENEYDTTFNELNPENLNIIRNALAKVVSLAQQETIHEISNLILKCRHRKEGTWLVFEGSDTETKKNVSKELARVIFGAYTKYVSIGEGNMVNVSSTDQPNRKRKREESGCSSGFERFSESLSENPHRVFFIEDFDNCSLKNIEQVINSVKSFHLKDAIVIFSSTSRKTSSSRKNENEDDNDMDEDRKKPFVSLDLNISIQEDTSRNRYSNKFDHQTGILEYVDRRFLFDLHEEIVTPKNEN